MLFQRRCPLLKLWIFVYAAALLYGCSGKTYSSPQGYDLNNPVMMELGDALVEISGILFNEETGTLLAISDSKRNVFEIDVKNQKLRDFTGKVVPPDSDLEDISRVENSLYLLSSKGLIIQIPADSAASADTTAYASYQINLPEPNDFETLYYDPSAEGLVMLCKSCASDKGEKQRSAFRFRLDNKTFDSTSLYSISTEEVKKMVKDENPKFDPSSAAIHPISKRLYILSSAGNLLVVADTRGKVIEAYKLNPDLYPQAEGIAFAPDGDMFISNEGKYGKPTLYYFPYQKTEKKSTQK